MSAYLIVEIRKEYPNDFDLTNYDGCVTVVEAAKLDEEMFHAGAFGLDELTEGSNVTVSTKVMGEV